MACLACLSFIPLGTSAFLGTVCHVQTMVLDIANDSIRKQVLHTLPLAQGSPHICSTNLVWHWLPGQVNVVSVFGQDG